MKCNKNVTHLWHITIIQTAINITTELYFLLGEWTDEYFFQNFVMYLKMLSRRLFSMLIIISVKRFCLKKLLYMLEKTTNLLLMMTKLVVFPGKSIDIKGRRKTRIKLQSIIIIFDKLGKWFLFIILIFYNYFNPKVY